MDKCTDKRIVVVDLFCGAGGFSCGAKSAGAEIALAVDAWDVALNVHKRNHTNTTHWHMTLGCESPCEFAWRVRRFLQDRYNQTPVHIHVHASPPCQPFSTAKARKLTDAQTEESVENGLKLVRWTFEVIRELNPESWSFENVPSTKLKQFFKDYNGTLVACCDHGVPQLRRRYLMGSLPFKRMEREIPLTPSSVLSRFGYDDLQQYEMICLTSSKKFRRTLDVPAYTVTATHLGTLRNRRTGKLQHIKPREAAALQTFPDDYLFVGQYHDIKRMIGNAVPPRLAFHIINLLNFEKK